jgi:hypothetical protein
MTERCHSLVVTPSPVIPAQAAIHKLDSEPQSGAVSPCASFATASGYGSRAPLRGPGMTAATGSSPEAATLHGFTIRSSRLSTKK